ncbi:MAG: lamin tail domain-containing protein [Polyangiaceae bacterium]|nr:lamin tail domain-containing protein [Polyangiaceae bacterium]
MRSFTSSLVTTVLLGSLAALGACGDDTSDGGGSGGSDSPTTSTTTTSTKASTGSTSSSSTTSTSTTSSVTTGAGGGVDADHLLINEVVVAPEGGSEFVEIHNPTAASVALDDYYLSDNSTYFDLANGDPWNPTTNNPGTDFLGQFPAGLEIPAGGYLVIGFDPGYFDAWGGCPDLYIAPAPVDCNGSMVPNMLETEDGSITDASNLSNSREMLVLFTWSGNTADVLQDVDYVTWGADFEDGSRADKTGVTGYQADTAPANQVGALAPMATSSIERCGPEVGETQSGGNGITGQDETSEDFSASFAVEVAPTPGVANVCP